MKKLFAFTLAAFAMMAVGCTKDDNPKSGEGSGFSVVGNWSLYQENDFSTLVLAADSHYEMTTGNYYKEEGTYVYSTTLTLTPVRAWENDSVWQEVEPRETEYTWPVKMLYDGDVMMLKMRDEYDESHEVWAPYVKDSATCVSNVNDIQGKWYWMMGEEHPVARVIVNVNGTTGDVIITPWGERYTGTIRYEKGIIYMDNPTFTTTRYEDGEGGWEHMNDADPENSPWRTPFGENPNHGAYEGGLSFTFVADGNMAYGGIANLLATFQKQ